MATKKKAAGRARAPRATPGSKVLARLREICLRMPDAVEKVSHGEPTFFAGEKGKVFAMFDNHHHGAPHVSVWLPTPREVQEALVASDPESYFVPPYLGPKGWTGVVLDAGPDWKAVEGLIQACFDGVKGPRKRLAKR